MNRLAVIDPTRTFEILHRTGGHTYIFSWKTGTYVVLLRRLALLVMDEQHPFGWKDVAGVLRKVNKEMGCR